MHHVIRLGGLVLGLLLACPAVADQAADEALLRGARVVPDGPGLVEFFRARLAKNEADEKKIEALIERLNSAKFKDREKATRDLIAIGLPARPFLARAAMHQEAEVRRRVAECLATIETANPVEIELAALRLLRGLKHDGACHALLQYLPAVRDAAVEEELFTTLAALAFRTDKADAALLAALKDRDASRRGAAVLLLAHGGNATHKEQIKQALRTETDALVRLRAGQGMLAARDKAGVAILLPLLTDAPREIAGQARDVLLSIGEEKAPAGELGEDKAARQKCRDEWERWWDTRQAKLDLSKSEVDLPWLNGNARAKKVVLRWTTAMNNGDNEEIKKTMGVPFNLAGYMVIDTREQLEEMFVQAIQGKPANQKIEFAPPRVVDLKEYLSRPMAAMMKEFLKNVPRSELRVVYLTGKNAAKTNVEAAYLFVRLKGGQAHIIGIGMADEPKKK